jgi:uncharacterized membrane protein
MIGTKKKVLKQKNSKPVSLQSASSLDVFGIGEGAISIAVEISKVSFVNNPFGNRESKLRVELRNAGEMALTDLALEALAPEGTDLVDPGALFGNARRYVRVKSLSPSQKITYKLGIRARDGFQNGNLVIRIMRVQALEKNQSHEMRIALAATAVN